MSEDYRKPDGTPCTLEWLVRNEPEWAASRIRHTQPVIDKLTESLAAALAEVERLNAELGEAYAYILEATGTDMPTPKGPTP